MSRPYKDITLNEGYTDLGAFEIAITRIEKETALPQSAEKPTAAELPRQLLFQIKCDTSGGDKLPSMRGEFEISIESTEAVSITQYAGMDGFVQIEAPTLPISTIEADRNISARIMGELPNREQEAYLKVSMPGIAYTLIDDFNVVTDKLSVCDGLGNYYPIQSPEIDIPSTHTAIYISKTGKVFTFDPGTETWSYVNTLTFYSFSDPALLTSTLDGFYEIGTSGPPTSGQIGTPGGPFPDRYITILNNDVVPIPIELTVYEGETSTVLASQSFDAILPGNNNFKIIEITCPTTAPDDTPTLTELETISLPHVYSTAFISFLTDNNLTTVRKIQNGGPISYLDGLPGTVPNDDIELMQSHIDLYHFTSNLDQNKKIIDSGYTSISQIATTPKNEFVTAVLSTELPLFRASEVHETIQQTQVTIQSRLAGVISDYRLSNSPTPDIAISKYKSEVLLKSANPCNCSECKSMVSPFAYLMELLKYGAEKIKCESTPSYAWTGDYRDFITFFNDAFFQPVGILNVSCDTLHDEFCRTRLVTEVLSRKYDSTTPSSTFINDRNACLNYVFRKILIDAGTSIEEVRNIKFVLTGTAKTEAAIKLSERIGISAYTGSTLNIDTMWVEDLTDYNNYSSGLQSIFGFRKIQTAVSTPTPVGSYVTWSKEYLRQEWAKLDYITGPYSREGVSSGFKTNWKPIIDPDIIGWQDIAYSSHPGIAGIYKNRMADNDAFLDACINGSSISYTTSKDAKNRIVEVIDRDLLSQVIVNSEVFISTGSFYNTYIIDSISINQLNSRVVLKNSSTVLAEPFNAKMRYVREIEYSNNLTSGISTYTFNWTDTVLVDYLPISSIKVKITNQSGTISYDNYGSSNALTVTGISGNQLIVNFSPNVPAGFDGPVKIEYEVEVNLQQLTTLVPSLLVTKLFTTNAFTYSLTTPVPGILPSTKQYRVWNPTWPSGLTGTDYEKLKTIYAFLIQDSTNTQYSNFVIQYLNLDLSRFFRVMELLQTCDNYLNDVFSFEKPSDNELFELASILRYAGKKQLFDTWVKEEYYYVPSSSTQTYTALKLNYFWKSLTEPLYGTWNNTRQTIPLTSVSDYSPYSALIDPEKFEKSTLTAHPVADPYRTIYDFRKDELTFVLNNIKTYINQYQGIENVLNYINTGNNATPYNITPYSSFEDLIAASQSEDNFIRIPAENVAWSAFRFSPQTLQEVSLIRSKLLSSSLLNHPNEAQLSKALVLLLTAFKRKQLFINGSTFPVSQPWVAQEVGLSLRYYNLFDMQLSNGRSDTNDRFEWQNTLKNWNKAPIIHPDIVSPEDIINFTTTNYASTTWTTRKNSLDSLYTTYNTSIFSASFTNLAFFNNLKDQINLLLTRTTSTTAISGNPLLHYFTEISDIEATGENITSIVNQLGFTITEYRFLKKIYDFMEDASPTPGACLLATDEIDSLINFMIHVRIVNLSYDMVMDEYDNGILLSPDLFENFDPIYPDLPQKPPRTSINWRTPIQEIYNWKRTLKARADQDTSVSSNWKKILKEVDDECMPVMRDAYIKEQMTSCESFTEEAEGLARLLMVETRDNCCVLHTRVSFAIETLQKLIFAIQNGIYDTTSLDFTITAPNFKNEWEWLGTYENWRSAKFVFLYPENLLHPTLRRLQSPAFQKLATELQNANRLSPEQACHLADQYNVYFDDIANINLMFTINAPTLTSSDDQGCCIDNSTLTDKNITYYIGKGPSGKSYWSYRDFNSLDVRNSQSFWFDLDLPLNAEPLGGFVCAFNNSSGGFVERNILLFYSFLDKGKLTVAYKKKSLNSIGSSWDLVNLPELPDDGTSEKRTVTYITACQQANELLNPTFIFQYANGANIDKVRMYDCRAFEYSVQSNKWLTTPKQVLKRTTEKPQTAIRLGVNDQSLNWSINYNSICLIFYDSIVLGTLEYQSQNAINEINTGRLIGAYQTHTFDSSITVLLHGVSPMKALRYSLNVKKDVNNESKIEILNTTNLNIQIYENTIKVFPNFRKDRPLHFDLVSKDLNGNKLSQSLKEGVPYSPNYIMTYNRTRVCPTVNTQILAQSINCTIDPLSKAKQVKKVYRENNLTNSVFCSTVDLELVKEVSYFVPMLIALDQQRRGQFESALNWYRSVYDYTQEYRPSNSINNRRIYYGFVEEAKIQSTFDYLPQYLTDPLNPHAIAATRANAYTKYTLQNIIQCLNSYGDQYFTQDTIESVPLARMLYSTAIDLLAVEELNLLPKECQTEALNCLYNDLVDNVPEAYYGLLYKLVTELASIGVATQVNSIATTIRSIFAGSSSLAEKFEDSFDLVLGVTPITPIDVTDLMNGYKTDYDNAFRYVSGILNPSSDVNYISTDFSNKVANISGLAVGDLTTNTTAVNDKIAWLNTPLPNNSESRKFLFANSSGVQNFEGTGSYNPIAGTDVAFASNLAYSNANIFLPYSSTSAYAYTYTPLISAQFCLPINPVFNSLKLKSNVELFKIFNCMNIAGMQRELDVYSAATDSTTGIPVIGATGTLNLPGIKNYSPTQFRFRTLLERAKVLVSQSQQLESIFLSTLERIDVESYGILTAKQNIETSTAKLKLQDLRINQAQSEKAVIERQIEKTQFAKQHFNDLISDGLNSFEQGYLDNLVAIGIIQGVITGAYTANLYFTLSKYLNPLSLLETGSVSGYGTNSGWFDLTMAALSSSTSVLQTRASWQSTMASYERRKQDWQFQESLSSFDLLVSDAQKVAADNSIRVITQEKSISELELSNANDTLNFLNNKFTNAALYNWMSTVLEKSYSYMLNLSTSVAKAAETQLYFERQEQAGPFILDDYWEAPSSGAPGATTDRRGLTGSARLLVDLTKLEQFAMDTNKRKLQITKTISLRNYFPEAFNQFTQTGVLNFELTNKMFDYDYPGHYLRLINSVKTTVIGLIPPAEGIKATLTAGTVSYTVIGGNTFQRVPIKRLDVDAVALSSPNNATGLFEMQPIQNELLNPFEGMGLESKWEFKLPAFSNRFDLANIGDVYLTVEYTAFDSYLYRTVVLDELNNELTFNKAFSLRNDFPDQWFELNEVEEGSAEFSINIPLSRDFYPLGITNLSTNVSEKVLLYFARRADFEDEISIADFNVVNLSTNTTPNPATGVTNKGIFKSIFVTNAMQNSPVVTLKLTFVNTPENRELFTGEKVTDIFIVVPCRAELPKYPL